MFVVPNYLEIGEEGRRRARADVNNRVVKDVDGAVIDGDGGND